MTYPFRSPCYSLLAALSVASLAHLQAQSPDASNASAVDPFAKSGNSKPRIVTLTAEEEAAILEDVTVPDEFDVRLFSPAATANYPVYVASAPNGDLYVSSDGNGSLGRDPGRGRVLRLRDANDDGRADEVTEFVPDVDSPRGLIWDHDRLYLLHPPHISVYFDRDGDGRAEASQRLIEGIAFGFADRPADHTTNGLELGIDGWIYIAGGDFGFMDAKGTDGRHLQHRGGGVIRFRPDGSGLELFATGTRNILGTPMSPLLDMFARDNTNDGGGWDVRLHHFSGLEDHGYPRLYKNFTTEHIHPLADYGGGSGCGSVYIHEPGFPAEWGAAPFTCDWGRAGLFRHQVERQGASFIESETPRTFIKMTRPTDADVDGRSRVYQASWKGPATFSWKGPDVGYIVQVRPKDFQPTPVPAFDQLDDTELIALLESPSHVRTLAAQRTLLRRPENGETRNRLLQLAANPDKPLRSRIASLYAISQRGTDSAASSRIIRYTAPLARVPELKPFVLRAFGDMGIDRRTAGDSGPVPLQLLVDALDSPDSRTRLEALVATARQGHLAAGDAVAANLGHPDPRIAHTAFRTLAVLGASDPCLAILDATGSTPQQRQGAAYALMRMHHEKVVDNLIGRLQSDPPQASIQPILSALCRLVHREAKWTGDSWGTRPDTRGPYYQPESWGQSNKIIATLKEALESAAPDEAAALVAEMNRNRIQTNDALNRIVELASANDVHIPTAITQLAAADSIPERAIPIVLKAARNDALPPMVMAQVVQCLTQVNHRDALPATIAALTILDQAKGAGKAQQMARDSFLNKSRLDNHVETLVELGQAEPPSRWVGAGILMLASRKNSAPEARDRAAEHLNIAWQNPAKRVTLMQIASSFRNHYLDDRIRAALNDLDPDVAKAARQAARRLRIQSPGEDTSPKITDLEPIDALAQVVATKGDPAIGEAVFMRAACATCHTVSQQQQQKGPYLGSIASTYRRQELAESILLPNKTIAQGFATNLIALGDDTEHTGFITNEAGDHVSLRDVAGQEHTFAKKDITERRTLELSVMPEGLMGAFSVNEMASLLDYLEGLAKKPD